MNEFSSETEAYKEYSNVKLCKDFKYIAGFEILNFQKPAEYHFESKDNEVGLLILEHKCDIIINRSEHKNLGIRENVFHGKPTGVYIPIDSKFSIRSQKSKIVICKAKCTKKTKSSIILPENVKIMNVGNGNWSRKVRILIGPDSPSVNLILGETINPAGNWSGTPPAKHEKNDLPNESLHEELYYFKTDKPQGWGIERIYSPERNINEFIYLKENVVTFMPWGYHQVVAGPGYWLYYLFFLAGRGKDLISFSDPQHKWLTS